MADLSARLEPRGRFGDALTAEVPRRTQALTGLWDQLTAAGAC
jgi:hypothetical protein